MKHDTISVTPLTFKSQLNQQRDQWGITVLLQFNSKIQDNKDYIDQKFDVLAKELKGMVRFLAIDCAEWRMFCQETYNKDLIYPLVIIYPADVLMPPQVLSKELDVKTIKKNALKYVTAKHIEELTVDNINSFLTSNEAIPKVILFSTKRKYPVIIKALSNSFADRVLFGFVQPNDKALQKQYKIKKLPQVIVLRSPFAKPEVYTGKMNYLDLHNWINVHAETFVKGGGFTHSNSKESPWLKEKVPELTIHSYKDVCYKKEFNLCMIFVSNGPLEQSDKAMLESLANNNSVLENGKLKLKWSWINVKVEYHFIKILPKNALYPTLIALNTHKRLRFMALPSDKLATVENIKGLIESILSGNAKFTIIKDQKLPQFQERNVNVDDEL